MKTMLCSCMITLIATFALSLRAQPAIKGSIERLSTLDQLPQVLIVGDDVSLGYLEPVRKQLKGKAEVFHNPGSAKDTQHGLEHLEEWLGGKAWDVIYVNWGLDDIYHSDPKDDPKGVWGEEGGIKTLYMEYEDRLRKIARILQIQKSTVIWSLTTPVPEGLKRWKSSDVESYNEVAEEIMRDFGIHIHDLHSETLPMLARIQDQKSPYFTSDGYAYLGKKVADYIWRLIRPALHVEFSSDVTMILDTDIGPWLDIDDWFDVLIFSTLPAPKQGGIVMEHYATDWEEVALTNFLTMFGRSGIPIARGCQEPLKREEDGRIVHSQYSDGAELILKTMQTSLNPVRILCVGALTNAALAYCEEPVLFRKKIESVWFVGGMLQGYEDAHSRGRWDTNIHRDQIAADILFNSDVPLVWFPVSLELVVRSTGDHEAAVLGIDHPAIAWLSQGVDYWRSRRGEAWALGTQQRPGEGRRLWSIFAHATASGRHPEWVGFQRGWARFSPQDWSRFEEDPLGPDLLMVKRNETALANWYVAHITDALKR